MDVTVGVLSPGKVGERIVAACRSKRRIWAGNNRSRESHKRAKTAGLEDVGSINEVAYQSDLIISILPPGKAIRVAESVRNSGFQGVYVDLNTLGPESVKEIDEIFEESKIVLVDGAVIPGRQNGLEIFLSGPSRYIDLFKQLFVNAEKITVSEMKGKKVGQASALKMVHKFGQISDGIFLNHMAYAERMGILDYTSSLLGKCYPDHYRNFKTSIVLPRNREMREIAQSFADEGVYDGFTLSAAQFLTSLKTSSEKNELSSEEAISEVLKEAMDLKTNKVKILDQFEKRESFASIPDEIRNSFPSLSDLDVRRDSFASISDNASIASIPDNASFASIPFDEEKLEI